MSTINKKVIVYVPTNPVPVEQDEVFALKFALLRGPNTRLAVLIMSSVDDPEHGDVVDATAPQRAAASTETCNRLFTHTIQPVCIIPKINSTTGSATKENSTAAAPRLLRNSFLIREPGQ